MTDYANLIEQARNEADSSTYAYPDRAKAQRLFRALADAVEALTAERDEAREERDNWHASNYAEMQMRHRAEAAPDLLAAALTAARDGYDAFYDKNVTDGIHKLLNAEKIVREALAATEAPGDDVLVNRIRALESALIEVERDRDRLAGQLVDGATWHAYPVTP